MATETSKFFPYHEYIVKRLLDLAKGPHEFVVTIEICRFIRSVKVPSEHIPDIKAALDKVEATLSKHRLHGQLDVTNKAMLSLDVQLELAESKDADITA